MNTCDFCHPTLEMNSRTVRETEHAFSLVSNPSWRDGQTLVVPKRHITEVGELDDKESVEVLRELGRLAKLLDEGYGYGIAQKYQPTQEENGIKMNHLHFHVFPRFENEKALFPVPEPNDFNGFHKLDEARVVQMAERLK